MAATTKLSNVGMSLRSGPMSLVDERAKLTGVCTKLDDVRVRLAGPCPSFRGARLSFTRASMNMEPLAGVVRPSAGET
jgi:hypothetical protein